MGAVVLSMIAAVYQRQDFFAPTETSLTPVSALH
jgi:hypothetical protein